MTPGTQPHNHKRKTIKIDPQPNYFGIIKNSDVVTKLN